MTSRGELLRHYYDFYFRYYGLGERTLESFGYCVDYIDMIISVAHKSDKILEFGCGVGFNLNYFYQKGFRNLYGTDISSEMLEEAKEKFEGISFRELGALNERNFDLIFTRAVLQEKENTDTDVIEILKTFHSLLEDIGALITIEGQSVRAWIELFSEADFELELQQDDFFKWRKVINDG